MKTVAIIPVWNANADQHDWTVRNVRTLVACNDDLHGIYVDNASTYHATRPYLQDMQRARPSRLTLIENSANKGYGGALNQGLLLAYHQNADLFICLNNDIEFLRPDWYAPFAAELGRNPRVLMGPRSIPDNNWVHFDGAHHPYLEGYCLAFGRTFLQDVGFFDEAFFPAWCEDVELSWRAMMRGYALVELRHIAIAHAGGRTGYDGRVEKYLTDAERNTPSPSPFGRHEPPAIQAARRLTQRQVDVFTRKVREGRLDWQGPRVRKEKA